MSTPTVCADFDGVIHRYSRGWQDGTIYDEPVEGSLDALRKLMETYAVVIHTTRRNTLAVAKWLQYRGGFGCTIDSAGPDGIWREFWNDRDRLFVTTRKLPAVAYIDDRAIRFRNWAQALMELAVPDSLSFARLDVAAKIADAEPVASFIAQVVRADSLFRQMTADEAIALPDAAGSGLIALQQAVRTLGVAR